MTAPISRDDILYSFAVEPRHDRETLERYLCDYPEFAQDLVDLSFELRISDALPESAAVNVPDPGLDAAWERFAACRPEPARVTVPVDPFAPFKGKKFAGLATVLQVPRSFLTAFRDRLVQPSTIPGNFICRLAQALEATEDSVRSYLSLPPTIAPALDFKAETKPKHQGQVTFQELVQNSELSNEQRQHLLQD